MGDFGDAVQTFRCNRRIWEARKSTPTLLRDARLSTLVTIVGFLEADTSLRAPLTLAPCIVHRIRVGERREDFDMVQVFANGGGRVPFVVVDDEGARVRVGAEEEAIVGPTLVDVTDTALVYGDNDVLGEVIGRANAARAIDAATRKVGVFFEDRFVAGERILVRGFLEETTELVAAGYRDAVGRVSRLRATPDHDLVITRP